jgi:hypothetical protein
MVGPTLWPGYPSKVYKALLMSKVPVHLPSKRMEELEFQPLEME